MKISTRSIVAAAAFAAFASLAAADTVTMSFTGTGKGQNLKVTFNGNSNNFFVGQIKHNISSGTGFGSSLVGDQITYCGDLAQYVSSSASVFTINPVETLAGGINGPTATARGQAVRNIFAAFGTSALSSSASNDLGTAFQMAVWELLYDGPTSVSATSGNVRFAKTDGTAISSALLTQFNTIMAAANTFSPATGAYALMSSQRQDQLIYIQNLVPTPGSAALMGLGSLCLLSRRRQRN